MLREDRSDASLEDFFDVLMQLLPADLVSLTGCPAGNPFVDFFFPFRHKLLFFKPYSGTVPMRYLCATMEGLAHEVAEARG